MVTAEWVRLKCQFGCGGYGRRLTCPPYSPTPERTRAVLDEYGVAILVHNPGRRNWKSMKRIVSELERGVPGLVLIEQGSDAPSAQPHYVSPARSLRANARISLSS